MVNVIPSAMPSTAALRSDRAGLVKASGRNGPTGGGFSFTCRSRRTSGRRPATARRLPCPAAAARSPSASTPTRAQSNHGPELFADLEADAGAEPRRARGLDLDEDAPGPIEQLARAAQELDGIAADADVPVEQQRGAPAAGAGHVIEDASFEDRDRSRTGVGERAGRDVDAEHRDAALGEGEHVASGSASDVEDRTDHGGERALLGWRRRRGTTGAPVRADRRRRCRAASAPRGSCRDLDRGACAAATARTSRANASSGCRGRDVERVGERVDVGRRRNDRGPQSERAAGARAGVVR